MTRHHVRHVECLRFSILGVSHVPSLPYLILPRSTSHLPFFLVPEGTFSDASLLVVQTTPGHVCVRPAAIRSFPALL